MDPEEHVGVERWSRRRKLAAASLIVTLLAGAALVLLPIGWQINRFIVWLFYFSKGLFGFSIFTLEGYDFLLNVLLFAVPALLTALVWPNIRWPMWALLGGLLSCTIELVQGLALPREASLRDWVANTLGALLGAYVAKRTRPRRVARGQPDPFGEP